MLKNSVPFQNAAPTRDHTSLGEATHAIHPGAAVQDDRRDPQTFSELLHRVAHIEHKGFTFLDSGLEAEHWPFASLAREAQRRGRFFRSLGLNKGDRLAIMVPEGRDFILSFYGAVTAGIVPVPMYPPVTLDRMDAYLKSAAGILRTAGAKVLLTSNHLLPNIESLRQNAETPIRFITAETLMETKREPLAEPANLEPVEPDDICFLQFTSGSTSDPKGVVITHRNLLANARAIIRHGLEVDPDRDIGVSWLPMFHDMGLIGFALSPLLAQVAVVIIPTLTFVRRPHVWMSTISKYRGTITFGPNFAFGLAAKRMRNIDQLDLSCLRVLGCGAEPINPRIMRRFVEVFQPSGLDPNALLPSYGMAEATLAITFDSTSRPMRTLTIDRHIYEADHRAAAFKGDDPSGGIELVSCGRSFADHEVAILGRGGEPLGEGLVGEVVFRGPSVTTGYYNNPSASAELLKLGWMHTGDLGFVQDGDLYISGRKKDIIIIHGRNYYPQAIEWEIEDLDGIRQGNAVAFSTKGEDSERLIIVAEAKTRDRAALEQAVRSHITAVFGIEPKEVILVSGGALPKTSSGKLQRRKTKSLFEAGSFTRGDLP